ncbi:MAG: NYN domain-containing protein [Mailhella sp.]|nr:NYN domain-containing protein [Mailhella sp.]
MAKVTFIVDGEFMRKRIISLKAFYFDGQGIRRHCLSHLGPGDTLSRILFYDALPFTGKGEHPLSGPVDFSQTPLIARKQQFLQSLRVTPEISLRLGRSAWQAGQWQLDSTRLGELMAGEIGVSDIESGDIYPDIRQKGVDMRLGLDIAGIAYRHQADKLVLVANDADYVPAVKLLREEGIKVVLDPLWTRAAEDLREHVDYVCNRLPRPQHSGSSHGAHVFDDPKEYDPFAPSEERNPDEEKN